ncbi:LA_0364 family Cys-rich lipoprotein [Leptospira tipperaryensis]|uniref:LA_0364 family Cys-rich lipoprotein n=1 Tax=Leptospira tipperaryensis TaxID=2564040 RepID=UPI0009F2AF0A|nr:hypothetical protein [Leptospira tipperaryensis]
MKKYLSMTLVILFVAVSFQCSEISPRQKCYEDNYCKSADSDCVAASLLITALLQSGSSSGSSSSSSSNNSFLSLYFSPLACIGAKASCEADCDKKHPF